MRTIVNAASNESIDLRYATIDTLALKHAHIEVPLKLSECRIETLDCHNTQFKERVECRYATIDRFTAKSGIFQKRVGFQQSNFGRANSFNATFEVSFSSNVT